ncbi:hypothetical protein H1230_16690 [Paenibacillus sp. 19GGS1-52]|uniref:hypothetical protein n=1 Tax=Paenibacillus sp. 19GGS1-52 TaxID=2758563 RepID=UPI001EFB376D|nr:hypothetical protein [Paenibacillus sp. 19GGS1-52]ULO04791.1 hypothetical protein H1230_16690 [Paenibacillus sp. 19GGS1-52]
MESFSQVRVRVHNWLDNIFWSSRSVKDWEGKLSLMTLLQFPTPKKNVSTGGRDILVLKTEVKHEVGIKRVEQFFATAGKIRRSIGLCEGLRAVRIEL